MPAFKRFGPGDQIDNVLVLEPTWVLASGTSGWRGSPEGSASVSLYGGYNRQPGGVVREYAFQRTIQGTDSFGKLSRSEPITASVNFVWMTDETLNLTQRSSTRWGHEHWKTVMRLYDYYRRRDPDYVTSSYDHYVLYLQRDSRNVVVVSGNVDQTTGSFTIESWVKPLLTSSTTNDFTIQSRNNVFWLGITGSTGRLALSSSYGVMTSSRGPTLGAWSHVAVAYDSATLSGIFYLDLQNVGTFTMSPLTASVSATVHSVGNRIAGYGGSPEGDWSTGSLRRSFHGLIGESRVWRSYRTYSQVSSSYNHRLTGSDLSSAQIVLWFNDGPLGLATASLTLGSGALDQAQLVNSGSFPFAKLKGFDDRLGPVWHPSDNASFYVPKQFTSGTAGVTRMLALSVPAGMYGRRIVPESLTVACRGYDNPSYGLIRTLIDDGRGGLFLSGSVASASLDGPSVGWNKVGNVFYDEGLVIIRDPSLLDFAGSWMGVSEHPADLLQLSFRGESRIPVKTLMCRIDRGDLNASLNPTFSSADVVTERFLVEGAVSGSATLFKSSDPSQYIIIDSLLGGSAGNSTLIQVLTTSTSPGAWLDIDTPSLVRIRIKLSLSPTWGDLADVINSSAYIRVRTNTASGLITDTYQVQVDGGHDDLYSATERVTRVIDPDRIRRHPSGSLYVSTVGIYSSDRELVGVARLAEPLRVRPRDRMNVKLRMDF